MECSVLFAYTLDAQGHPEIWEIRFISDKDCGTRLETFRLNADSANSKEKFRPTLPPRKENIYRLDRIYKVQIQDDRQGFCSPPGIYEDCLFLLETVPVPAFQYKNAPGNVLSGGVLDFGGSRTLCGLTTFQSFDAQLLLSPLVAPYGQALWRFTAEVQKNAPLLEWKRFSFFSKALDKDDQGDPITDVVSFLKQGKQRLRDSLEPALTDTEQTPGRQWNFPIDDISKPAKPKILRHLGVVLDHFPARNGAGEVLKVGLALFPIDARNPKNRITLKIVSLPAGKDKVVAASIFDYRSLAAKDHPLQPLTQPDTAQLRLLSQPAATLSTGPQTTGNPAFPDFSKAYSPYRKIIFELHSIPTRLFITFWNSQVDPQLDSLKLTQAGNPVSFVPKFEDLKKDSYFWILAYEVLDTSDTEGSPVYALTEYRSEKRLSGSSIELISMRAGKLSQGDSRESFSLTIPNVNPIHKRGSLALLKTFISTPNPSPFDRKRRGIYFDFDTPIYGEDSGGDPMDFQVRMGAFDLTIQRSLPEKESDLYGQLDISLPSRQPIIEVKLKIAMSDCSPGGQDYPPETEFAPPNSDRISTPSRCEDGVLVHASTGPEEKTDTGQGPFYEAMYEEESPVTIYLPPKDRSGKYLLQAREWFRDDTSHTLDLYVFNKKPFGGAAASIDVCDQPDLDSINRVYVIERNPFLVAKVAFLPIGANAPETPLAFWTNRADRPRGWQVNLSQDKKSTASPVCLTLPPQGIGETMLDEKNRSPSDAKLSEDEFYKRLSWSNYSPPANFHLSVSDEGLTFTAAPWNLHNLFSNPALAPYVKQLDFELFYGLSCVADQPLIRLLDTFAIVGKIPPRPSPQLAWTTALPAHQQEATERYAKLRADWAMVYRRWRNRLAVLEPVPQNSSALDPSIVLQKNLSCWIRLPDASNLKPPKDLSPTDFPNTDEGKAKYEALKAATLQGGVTNGFVSKNVYLASVFKNSKDSARSQVSSSAQLSHFSFTALGGNGRQMAGFQNNLTRIYADVHLGRAYRYKVERIGRIACFWNVAKHVVVYERRVAPTKQFADPKYELPAIGWPYIRKVEEYVEIIDDKLDFPPAPEPGSNVTSEHLAELRSRCACVTGIQFQPCQRFNVRSEWGIDVGDWGWKIPLWDPSAGKAEPEVFPEQHFHLRLAPHDSQDRAYELKRFRKPEQVYFYTITKVKKPDGSTAAPDGDPRNWPSEPSIDLVNLPDPVPASDFADGDSRQYTSPEASCPVGFSGLTFDLETSGPPINLTENRGNSPIAAQLTTITVSRSVDLTKSLPPVPPVNWANLASSDAQFAALKQLENRLTDLFKVLLKEFPVGQVLEPGLGARIQARVETLISNELQKLIDDTTALKNQLVKGPFNPDQFKAKVGAIEELALTRVLQRIDDAVAQAKTETADRIQALKDSTNFSADGARAILADIGARISETLLLIGSAPGQSARYVSQMTKRLVIYIDQAKKEFAAALGRIKTFAARPETTLVACQRQLRIEFATLQSIEEDFFRSSSRYLPTGMADALSAWRRNLNSYFGLFDQSFSAVIKVTIKTKDDFTIKLNAVAVPAALDDLQPIKDFLKKFSSLTADAANDWDALVQSINSQVLVTYDSIAKPWIAAINAAQQTAINNYNDFDAALKTLLANVTDSTSGIRKTIIDYANKAKNAAGKASSLLESTFADFQNQLNGAAAQLRKIAKDLANNVDQMQAEIIRYKDQLVSSARDWAEHCAGPLVDDITKSNAYQAGDTALRLVRALGDPPRTAQMKFEQSQLGYYFKQALPGVNLSPAYMALDQGAAALEALKPLGLRLPCSQILDQLIPSSLKNFDLRTIFPNFAGIDLSNLLPGIKVPDFLDSRYVKVTHGLDREKRRAYAKAEVDFTLDKPATILNIGPVKLSVPSAAFHSTLSIGASQSGGIDERQVSGSLQGDWALSLAGTDLITLGDAKLLFNDHGGVHFEIDPLKVRLPDFLKFVTEALKGLIDPDSGLSFGAIPHGFQCVLDLPIPDTSAATSGISGLTLSASLALLFDNDFAIQIGCALGKPDKPFNVAFFILGGGGYVFCSLLFRPSTGAITCGIDLRITASASLSIALGPIRGGVYVYLGVTATFRSGGGSSSFGVIFIIRGDVSICGIISAYVALTLSASYDSTSKAITGEGRLDVEVKICWCFTFKIHQSLSYTLHLGSDSSHTTQLDTPKEILLAQNEGIDPLQLGVSEHRPYRTPQEIHLAPNRAIVAGSQPPNPPQRVLTPRDAAQLYSKMLF